MEHMGVVYFTRVNFTTPGGVNVGGVLNFIPVTNIK